MCPSLRKILAALILFLAMRVSPVAADNSLITLKNQTYTPMHYRVGPPDGAFSNWYDVLPGESARFRDYGRLIAEVSLGDDHHKSYDLASGATYVFYRRPGAVPDLGWSDDPLPPIPVPPPAPSSTDSSDDSFAPLELMGWERTFRARGRSPRKSDQGTF